MSTEDSPGTRLSTGRLSTGRLSTGGKSASFASPPVSAAARASIDRPSLERPSIARGSSRSSSAKIKTAVEMTFSLDEPPPVSIGPSELLTRTADGLPDALRCTVPDFDADATCRDACLLTTHTFWYCFCALQQPGSEATQAHLLRLMGQHAARLSVGLRCERDAFFDHFPPLLAHAVLQALRRHSALPKPDTAYARSLMFHLVTLLGAYLPQDLLQQHCAHAERPPVAAGERLSLTQRTAIAETPEVHRTQLQPPLLMQHVPPMFGGAGGAGSRLSTATSSEDLSFGRRRSSPAATTSCAPPLAAQASSSLSIPWSMTKANLKFKAQAAAAVHSRETESNAERRMMSVMSAPSIARTRRSNKPHKMSIDLKRQVRRGSVAWLRELDPRRGALTTSGWQPGSQPSASHTPPSARESANAPVPAFHL